MKEIFSPQSLPSIFKNTSLRLPRFLRESCIFALQKKSNDATVFSVELGKT